MRGGEMESLPIDVKRTIITHLESPLRLNEVSKEWNGLIYDSIYEKYEKDLSRYLNSMRISCPKPTKRIVMRYANSVESYCTKMPVYKCALCGGEKSSLLSYSCCKTISLWEKIVLCKWITIIRKDRAFL